MKKVKKIVNPLTIIGIFAGLAEIAMITALGLVDKSLQPTFIWFVMGFPVLLVVLFFLTLNFNTKVIYAPSDFKDEKLFMESMNSIKIVPKSSEADMSKIKYIKNQKFFNSTIDLDNKDFFNCIFESCIMRFSAIGYIGISQCTFDNVNWSFDNNASQTIMFLSSLYSEFGESGKNVIEITFDNIKNGTYKSNLH